MIPQNPKKVIEQKVQPLKGLYLDGIYPEGSLSICKNFRVDEFGNLIRRGMATALSPTETVLAGLGFSNLHTLRLGAGTRYLYSDLVYTSGANTYWKIRGSTVTGTNALTLSSWADITTALTYASAVPCWQTAQNKAFRVDGVNANKYYKDVSASHNNGVTAPSVAPTLADTTGGTMTAGTYYVKYTYVKKDGSYVVEGNPSSSTSITITNNAINVSHTVSGDADVGYIRIYCTLMGYTDYYYYITEVANATATTKITSVAINTILETDNDVPPICKYILWAGSRMFYLNMTNTTTWPHGNSQMMYSKIDEPEHVPALYVNSFDPLDNYEITGGGLVQNYVVVFKRYKTYLCDIYSHNILADGIAALAKQDLSRTIGCYSHRSIQRVGLNSLIWLSDEGVILFDGGTLQNVTENKINSVIKTYINYGTLVTINSYYDVFNKDYHLLFTYRASGNTVTNSRHLIYRLDSNLWSEDEYKNTSGTVLYETCLAFCIDGYNKDVGLLGTLTSTTGTTGTLYQLEYGDTETATATYTVLRGTDTTYTLTKNCMIGYDSNSNIYVWECNEISPP